MRLPLSSQPSMHTVHRAVVTSVCNGPSEMVGGAKRMTDKEMVLPEVATTTMCGRLFGIPFIPNKISHTLKPHNRTAV